MPTPAADADLVLRSRRVVTPDGQRPATIVVRAGRIEAVLDRAGAPAGPVTDVGDLVVLPGLVDSHVHVNEPGRTHWEGFATATAAAALGGVTTLVDMPLNSLPPTIDPAALAAKRDAAGPQAHVDIGFWGGVVPGSEDHLGALHDAGVFGFKAFLCGSGVAEYGDFAPDAVASLAQRVAALDALLIVHAEHPDLVAAASAEVDASHPDPRRYTSWLDGRPPAAEEAAIAALVDAARATGARIHVLHLSAAGGAALIAAARAEGLPVTVETCPHYLTLAAEDVPDGATAFKCAPPIRDRANRDALWAALADGTIDAIVSDHSPAPAADKALDTGDLLAAWGGIASLQLGLPAVWTAAAERGHTLDDVVRWMSAGPARLLGARRKGAIVAGAEADLVVFDPEATWTVDAARLAHRHPVTPYDGQRLRGVVRTTYLAGRPIAHGRVDGDRFDGEVVDPPRGRLRTRGDL
ncbi:allantoinase AllB [Nitriliruptoraceae bacterium ZYF776]|nr:allantoinase AllB [Profundirhabdus halotolerans]